MSFQFLKKPIGYGLAIYTYLQNGQSSWIDMNLQIYQ